MEAGQMAKRRAIAPESLAANGGERAITGWQGRGEPKVGVEEFVALAEVFGYSREAQEKVRKALTKEADHPSPQLARYYNPRPSSVDQLEAYARKLFGVKHA